MTQNMRFYTHKGVVVPPSGTYTDHLHREWLWCVEDNPKTLVFVREMAKAPDTLDLKTEMDGRRDEIKHHTDRANKLMKQACDPSLSEEEHASVNSDLQDALAIVRMHTGKLNELLKGEHQIKQEVTCQTVRVGEGVWSEALQLAWSHSIDSSAVTSHEEFRYVSVRVDESGACSHSKQKAQSAHKEETKANSSTPHQKSYRTVFIRNVCLSAYNFYSSELKFFVCLDCDLSTARVLCLPRLRLPSNVYGMARVVEAASHKHFARHGSVVPICRHSTWGVSLVRLKECGSHKEVRYRTFTRAHALDADMHDTDAGRLVSYLTDNYVWRLHHLDGTPLREIRIPDLSPARRVFFRDTDTAHYITYALTYSGHLRTRNLTTQINTYRSCIGGAGTTLVAVADDMCYCVNGTKVYAVDEDDRAETITMPVGVSSVQHQRGIFTPEGLVLRAMEDGLVVIKRT